MTHPITIDAARLTWDGRTPAGTELRAWLESLPGSEFATGLLILADALDREPTRPEPTDIGADLDELADCTKLFAEAMQKMKAATDSVARKSVARLASGWVYECRTCALPTGHTSDCWTDCTARYTPKKMP